jgi:thiol-disulfide isomerase/thioredoxin
MVSFYNVPGFIASTRDSGMAGRLRSRIDPLVTTLALMLSVLLLAVLASPLSSRFSSQPGQLKARAAKARLASLHQDAQPSLEGGVGWINSGPIDLAQLKGKIVLLDFWTYCCINCHHVLPDLARLEAKYGKELVVIGVHSAKFDAEKDTGNIRRKVDEYRIKHPVVNDANMVIWRRFGVNSWPTLVLIDPTGAYLGSVSGENHYDLLDRTIAKVAEEFKGQLNLKPIEFPAEQDPPPKRPLLFPGKVLADGAGKRLFVSDTGHNRIIQTDLEGKAAVVIGSGAEGLVDGGFDKARFNRPQGMCLAGTVLYVADTENHAIRAVDLKARHVSTVSGTGAQSRRNPMERFVGPARRTALSSPWDLIQIPGSHMLYIAMAGTHQIWRLDIKTDRIGVWAGSGYENIEDGTLTSAKFAQPSGLATDGQNLFVADSEVSGVRVITGIHTASPEVARIVGEGLFEFGDHDGVGPQVRLQHCLGLTYAEGKLFIADTYNNKVKVSQPRAREVRTFAGDGKPGDEDNPPRFYQPGGLSAAGTDLYVADSNNHKIRVIDLKTGVVRTLKIEGLSPPHAETKVATGSGG